MNAKQLVDAIIQMRNGYCDWTKHGTRSDEGRYKTECNRCMLEAYDAAIDIATRALAAATAAGYAEAIERAAKVLEKYHENKEDETPTGRAFYAGCNQTVRLAAADIRAIRALATTEGPK